MTAVEKMKVQPATVQFTKGDSGILGHYQLQTAEDGTETGRWLFSTPQIAAMNGIPAPTGVEQELYAADEKERDKLAEQLLDAINAVRVQQVELNEKIGAALAEALPKAKPVEEESV